MNFDELNDPELQERLKNCKTPEEMLELTQEAGYELTDEELEGISGGVTWCGCNSWGKPCDEYDPNRCSKNMGV